MELILTIMLLRQRFILKKYLKGNTSSFFFQKGFVAQNGNRCSYHDVRDYVDNPKKRLALIVNENCVKKLITGYPWVFSNEIKNAEELVLYSPCIVNIHNEFSECVAVGIYNKNSSICARVLSTDVTESINENFFEEKLRNAYNKRIETFKTGDFFRVVNAESDFLPGIFIDKYGKIICVQVNASGIDILLPQLLKSVEKVFNPETIILKTDSSIRKFEKVFPKKEVYKGVYEGPTELRENGVTFFVDILNGQKTGWYFDQRENRFMLVSFSKNKTVLDLFSYVGSFGITLAYYGAKEVTCVDSSYAAICNGIKSASYNNVFDKITFIHSCVKRFLQISMTALLNDYKSLPLRTFLAEPNATCENMENREKQKNDLQLETHAMHIKDGNKLFSEMDNIHVYKCNQKGNAQKSDIIDEMEHLLVKNINIQFFQKKYDVILIDPPPLAKTHSLVASALKIYQKILFISFKILQKPGFVFVSSCNRLIGPNELNACVKKSLRWAKCDGVIISEGRMSADHPIHVALPETRYLTSLLLFVT